MNAILWVLTLLACGASLTVAGHAARDAAAAAHHARADLARIRRDLDELARLRDSTPPPPKRTAGLQPRVSAVLASSGLPASTLVSLSPEVATPTSGAESRLMRQRATLLLGGATLPQLGRFLSGWRVAEPSWIITSIELSPAPLSANLVASAGELPLRAVVVMESIFRDGSPQPADAPMTQASSPTTQPPGDAH
jgi:hypothetical protein